MRFSYYAGNLSMSRDLAWGRYYEYDHQLESISWRHQQYSSSSSTILPHGMGRSYGDSCLNHENILLETRALNRLISFDTKTGVLCCEAGVTLEEVIAFALPKGWFLPVTPGTKFVTLGGAIANDVHGKNHHLNGTFGGHVEGFELLRSSGKRLYCSPDENREYFEATIGGLGLTGLITKVSLKLMPVNNIFLCVEEIQYSNLEGFFALSEASKDWQYTVAWIDSLAQGKNLGRGIFIRANHAPSQMITKVAWPKSGKKATVPFSFPNIALNKLSVSLFNQCYWRKNLRRAKSYLGYYDPFFYPLDTIHHWNRIYGKRGFLQYQFVVPLGDGEAIEKILGLIAQSGQGSFLTVLKIFGDVASPGMLSFPMPGVTFALDFPNRGQSTLVLLDALDKEVLKYGGRVYPAKDARMSGAAFREFYPEHERFAKFIDPKFSSSFWRRVMQDN